MASTPRVLYDLIDTLIDSQISNTAMLTTILHILRDNQEEIKEINSHFTNGFKSDIKDHISEEQEQAKQLMNELYEKIGMLDRQIENNYREVNIRLNNVVSRSKEEEERIERIDNFVENTKKMSTYVKWIVAVVIAIGTIVGGIATVVEKGPWGSKANAPAKLPNANP